MEEQLTPVAVAVCAGFCREKSLRAWLRRQIVGTWRLDTTSADADVQAHTMQIRSDGRLLDWWAGAAESEENEYRIVGIG